MKENTELDYILEDIQSKNSIKESLDRARNTTNYKDMKIPEQIALENDMTLREMEEYISENRKTDPELEKTWVLYKESLKVKFALADKDTMNEMKANYNLGIDGKSFPNIGFYFDYDEKQDKALDVIIVQSMLQREKNKKEAASMGIEVMDKKQEAQLMEFVEDMDD